MTTYEYQILSEDSKSDTAKKLTELTAAGWEIVSSHPKTEGFFIFFLGFLSTVTTFVLRRPVTSRAT
jgi:hypothetical protein